MRKGKKSVVGLSSLLVVVGMFLSGCSPSQTYTSNPSDKRDVQIKIVVSGKSATLTCETHDNKLLANASAFAINRQTRSGLNNMLFGKAKTTFKALPKGDYDAWVSVMEFGGGPSGSRQISSKVPFVIR